jgi:hypothetical protein
MLEGCDDGTYLVRRSNGGYVLSVIWRKNVDPGATPITHVKVKGPEVTGKPSYALADVDDFPTLEALCRHYQVGELIYQHELDSSFISSLIRVNPS